MQEAGTKKENTKMVIVGFIGAVAVSALLVLIPLVQAVALNTQIMGLNKDIKKLSSINDLVNSYYDVKDKYNDVAAFAALKQTVMIHCRILLTILKRICQVMLLYLV